MNKRRIIYIGILFIVTVIVSITYFSYAYLTRVDEQKGKINIVAGTLDYKITSSDLNNNSITLGPNEEKEIEIEIKSLNMIDSKYQLYTNSVENVSVGYLETGDNSTGTIESNGTKRVKLVLRNTSNTSKAITLGVQGGLVENTITLETDRIAINEGTPIIYAYDFDYTGNVQTFTVPKTGTYKVEVWGASGFHGGNGAYTSGNLSLTENDVLYVYVGEAGFSIKGGISTPRMAYNGGGISGSQCSTYEQYGGYNIGGGSTDIRKISGNWDNADSLRSRVMVAAGGSGSGQGSSGNGAGGGLIGYDGVHTSTWGTGATQTAGGTLTGTFGKGGTGINNQNVCDHDGTGGGGSGWYGGGGSESNGANTASEGGGGSSYISGHTGCVAVTSTSSSNPKQGCTTGTSDKTCSISPYGIEFTETQMIDGLGCKWTNQKTSDCSGQPQPDGTIATGHVGNGYVRFTYLGTKNVRFNAGDGTSTEDIRTVNYGSEIGTLPTATRDGYHLLGWYTDANYTTQVTSTYVVNNDITLYAKWDEIVVTYDYLTSKPSATTEEATYNYNSNKLNITTSATNTANLGSRLIFGSPITTGGVIHIKGTMTVNSNTTTTKSKLSIGLGTSARGTDKGLVALTSNINVGTSGTFDTTVAIPDNTYVTLMAGRQDANITGGTLNSTIVIDELYITNY